MEEESLKSLSVNFILSTYVHHQIKRIADKLAHGHVESNRSVVSYTVYRGVCVFVFIHMKKGSEESQSVLVHNITKCKTMF